MRDGTRLAADCSSPSPMIRRPALLEALPYRKDDLTGSYADEYLRLRAEGGFAVCRLDVRGTGASEGRATDEYPRRSSTDLAEVIAWLAAQPWSQRTGRHVRHVYSGFNSLQLACRTAAGARRDLRDLRDPTTATPTTSTTWAARCGRSTSSTTVTTWSAMNALPPVPALPATVARRVAGAHRPSRAVAAALDGGAARRAVLAARIAAAARDYDRIACPTMIVAGWADGYRNNTFRTFEQLRCEKELLIGPWSHMCPVDARCPGPHIDLVPEMIRFFDTWLRDRPPSSARPPIRVFVRRLDEARARPRDVERRVAIRGNMATRAADSDDAVRPPRDGRS